MHEAQVEPLRLPDLSLDVTFTAHSITDLCQDVQINTEFLLFQGQVSSFSGYINGALLNLNPELM